MSEITSAEWEVMRVIWAKEKTTSSQIIETLAQKLAWSASTVKTLLGRLVDKGLVSSQRQGRAYIYQAELSEESAHLSEVKAVFERICVTEHSGLLAHLIAETPMTNQDIEHFQALLASKQTVKQVICDCVPGQCRCAVHQEEVSARG